MRVGLLLGWWSRVLGCCGCFGWGVIGGEGVGVWW